MNEARGRDDSPHNVGCMSIECEDSTMARIVWAATTFVAMCAVTAAIVAAPAGTGAASAAETSAVSVQVYKNAG